jgi:hypothetical protein
MRLMAELEAEGITGNGYEMSRAMMMVVVVALVVEVVMMMNAASVLIMVQLRRWRYFTDPISKILVACLTIPSSCHMTAGRCVQAASHSACKALLADAAVAAGEFEFDVCELLVVTHDRLGSIGNSSVQSSHALACRRNAP